MARGSKKYFMFGSFLLCCFGASLLAAALATQYWFQASCHTDEASSDGDIHFGLFEGQRTLKDASVSTHDIKVVCDDGDCMYSCGQSKDLRKQQLQLIRDGNYNTGWMLENCTLVSLRQQERRVVPFLMGTSLGEVFSSRVVEEEEGEEEDPANLEADGTPATPGSGEAEFMDYGLWAGTIACLCLGMLFAVVGALFAVINTATTPVEAITGVPGLYVWNTLAALFNLVCVICWAVQFHSHLTQNVLLYDQDNGWTTEGNEVFGYSYWLVVVAIFVHVANILIIFFGTYEPKVKEQMKAPEAKSGTIMLY